MMVNFQHSSSTLGHVPTCLHFFWLLPFPPTSLRDAGLKCKTQNYSWVWKMGVNGIACEDSLSQMPANIHSDKLHDPELDKSE